MALSDLSKLTASAGFTERNDPFNLFGEWLKEAEASEPNDPNAMALATVDEEGLPNVRMVLLKGYDERGFVFYTNFESAKARDISSNPEVALLFLWLPLERQVIIRGRAEKVSTTESMKYFLSRPRGSQLGAWVSQQSSVVSSRGLLEAKLEEMKQKFANKDVSLPSFWGGFRVVPRSVEFWQGRPNRMHDRFMYTRDGAGWKADRLAP